MIRFFILILIASIFASCSQMREYVKRSANEKVFDSKGFKSKKRFPVYNEKYIDRAKKNVEEDSFSDQSDDIENPYYEKGELKQYDLSNKKMYKDMAEMQEAKQNISNTKSGKYARIKDIGNGDEAKLESLKQEIKNIKNILKETQEKLSNYKCQEPIKHNLDKAPAENEITVKDITPPASTLTPPLTIEKTHQ